MAAFIARRILLGIITVLGVVTITFAIARVLPSDPAAQWVGPRATPEQREQARKELGLDKPLYVQYIKYVGDLFTGDLGRSLRSHQAVSTELKTYLPATLELVAISFFAAILIGLPLGVLSAQFKDRWVDHVSRFVSIGFVSTPVFWFGLFLQLIFFSWLGWLPIGDQLSTDVKLFSEIPDHTGFLLFDSLISANFVVFKDVVLHMVLPALALAAYPIGLVARMTRSALLEILGEDYIVAARSYGISERLVLWSYALKNSLGATATVVTLSIGYTLVNTFLVEAIFGWPGIGNYVATAVTTLDFPAIIGVTAFSAISYVFLNMVADLIITLDPRVRV